MRNDRFFKAANARDGTGVVDTRYGGYQEPGATGPYGFCPMVEVAVNCGGNLEIHNNIDSTDFCYVIVLYLLC